MSRQAKITWIGASLSALLFGGLAVISKLWLEPQGRLIFDSRVLGYDAETAWGYLRAVTPEQSALYRGPFRLLDTVFPISLGATLASLIWMQSSWFSSLRIKALILVPCIYVAADLTENAWVAVLLEKGISAASWEIALASAATQVKWAALLMTVMICAGLQAMVKRRAIR